MNIILNILKSIPLFESLSEAEHQSVIEHITLEYFPAHFRLFEKGDLGEAMYIIKSGMVQIQDGDKILATLGEGDFLGETALIESQARNASAETLSDVEAFMLKREDLAKLLQSSPEIAQKVQAAYQLRKRNN